MGLLHYLWSRTAAANATSDANILFSEGQSPGSLNDSCRALMASAAGFRDDIAGAIVTGGTSTAYTIASYQVFDTLPHMNGALIAFTPHTANGATVTLNVDSLGAKPLRPSTGVELESNVLIAGTPYSATYNSSDAVWYLHGLGGNSYGVPLGASMEFWLPTAPSSAFVFPFGQAINRTTYATLFALMGTTFGVGNGSTTFNIPDCRGRIIAGKDDMGGSAASRLTTAGGGVNGATLGAVGGAQNVTLITANLPAYTPAGSVAVSSTVVDVVRYAGAYFAGNTSAGAQGIFNTNTAISAQISSTGSLTGTAQGGTSTAFAITQPTIISNRILRVI